MECILARQPFLKAKIAFRATKIEDRWFWKVDEERLHRVAVKIARGLVTYELNEPRRETPATLAIVPLISVNEDRREAFENVPAAPIWPEVGSRAMQRLIVEQGGPAGWIVVQPGRFRYALVWDRSGGTVVRLVFSEYLAAEVIWR